MNATNGTLPSFPTYEDINIKLAFCCLFLIVSVTLNGRLLIALISSGKLREPSLFSWFIVNACIADIGLITLSVLRIVSWLAFGLSTFWHITVSLWTVCLQASQLTLVAMAVDRCRAILKPFSSLDAYSLPSWDFFTVTKKVAVCLVLWFGSVIAEFATSCPNNTESRLLFCTVKVSEETFMIVGNLWPMIFTVAYLLAIGVLYTAVSHRLARSTNHSRVLGAISLNQRDCRKRSAKIVIVLVALEALFCLPLPLCIVYFLVKFRGNIALLRASSDMKAHLIRQWCAEALLWTHTFCDPIALCVMSKSIKQQMLPNLPCGKLWPTKSIRMQEQCSPLITNGR